MMGIAEGPDGLPVVVPAGLAVCRKAGNFWPGPLTKVDYQTTTANQIISG